VIGDDGTAGRINVIATALQAAVWDPLLVAAQQLVKQL
jgi:hypothetical protein